MNAQTAKTYIHQELNAAGKSDDTTSNTVGRAVDMFRQAIAKNCEATLATFSLDRLVPKLNTDEMAEYVRLTTDIEHAVGNLMTRIEDKLYK